MRRKLPKWVDFIARGQGAEQMRASGAPMLRMRLTGVITDTPFEQWGDIAARDFVAVLDDHPDVEEIELLIDSPGGAVHGGVLMYNALKAHGALVRVIVQGEAASAASLVAMAGDEISMSPGTWMMLHDAATVAWGNSRELEHVAGALRVLSESSSEIYARRSGSTMDQVREWMEAETWFGPDAAVEAGLADRVIREEEGEGVATARSGAAVATVPPDAGGLFGEGWRNAPAAVAARWPGFVRGGMGAGGDGAEANETPKGARGVGEMNRLQMAIMAAMGTLGRFSEGEGAVGSGTSGRTGSAPAPEGGGFPGQGGSGTGEAGAPVSGRAGVSDALLRERQNEVRMLCELAGVDSGRTLELVMSDRPVTEIREELLTERRTATASTGSIQGRSPVIPGDDEAEKFSRGVVAALYQREVGQMAAMQRRDTERVTGRALPEEPREELEMADSFRAWGIDDIARRCIELRGERAPIGRRAVLRQAMAMGAGRPKLSFHGRLSTSPQMAGSGAFSHTPSDLTSILANVMNKSLQSGYELSPTTYQRWARTGSVADFKPKYTAALSESPELLEVGVNGEVPEGRMRDKHESVAAKIYGSILSLTWQTMVNDDLGAITRIPFKQAVSARRGVNKRVYRLLRLGDTSAVQMNETGENLFSTAHGNLTTTGSAFAQSTLQTLATKMQEQKGFGQDAQMLNLEPAFILAPPALRWAILEVLNSTAKPATSSNSGVANVTQGLVEPIIDPELSAAAGGSDAAWYLAALSLLIDTIEVVFLDGLDAPMLEEEEGFDVLGLRMRVLMVSGEAPMDFRGLAKATGAGGGG